MPSAGPLVGLGALAGGVDGGVLQQEDGAGAAGDHLGVDLALALPGLQVVDRAVGELLEDQCVHPSRLTRGSSPVENPR